MAETTGGREHWGSKAGFILAATGSAIGLGNIWKFPFITGMYGGAAFVIFYLASVLIIGLPVMLIEFAIGRRTQLSPVGALRKLSPNSPVYLIGGMGVLAGFVILAYYSVVAGWTLAYIFKAAVGGFTTLNSSEAAAAAFSAYASNPIWPLLTHAMFMFLCAIVVVRGVKSGIERWNDVLMPALCIILILLLVRGVTLKGAGAGIDFLLKPDFSKLTGEGMLIAMGHAFFTLSLGMGAMLTYGSYLGRETNIVSSALWIIAADTITSLMAGVAIFTAVFALGFQPDAGPGLVFHVLPAMFNVMPGGYVMGILFFVLLAIAALASGISLLEVVTAYFVDQRGWSRKRATIVFAVVIFVMGIPSALSFGVLDGVKLFGMSWFDFFDYMSFKYLLPLGGLLLVLYTIFGWGTGNLIEELRLGGGWVPKSKTLVTALLALSALFVTITFIAGLMGKG